MTRNGYKCMIHKEIKHTPVKNIHMQHHNQIQLQKHATLKNIETINKMLVEREKIVLVNINKEDIKVA